MTAVTTPPFRARDLFGRVKQHQKAARAFFKDAVVELIKPGHVRISSVNGSLTNALVQGLTVLDNKHTAMAKKGDSLEIVYHGEDKKITLAANWLPGKGFFNVNFAQPIGA